MIIVKIYKSVLVNRLQPSIANFDYYTHHHVNSSVLIPDVFINVFVVNQTFYKFQLAIICWNFLNIIIKKLKRQINAVQHYRDVIKCLSPGVLLYNILFYYV